MKDGKILKEGTPQEVMTKQLIKEVYGVDVIVDSHEETGMYMVPFGI
jgi:iron complex transport system ATP-binding protein